MLINGNTRQAALKELGEKHIRVGVLPPDAWLNAVLELRFSTLAGRALVSCDAASARHLQVQRGRHASGASISNQAFDIEIDDLLVNLHELASWPLDDVDIQWQPALLRVVEGNAADAAILHNRLSAAADLPALAPAELGPGWSADLTDFQRQDLGARAGHGANFSVPGAGKTRVALGGKEGFRHTLLAICSRVTSRAGMESVKPFRADLFGGEDLRPSIRHI